jgi:outer membrane receptor protein involved in Fe transport
MFAKFKITARPAIVLVALLAAIPPNVGAQVEEIVVTTRRTEENLQDVPVSVAAFNSDFIQKQGIATTEDVVKLIPGVQFDQAFSAADTRVSIRGINSERGRTSVAILLDGVDVSGENVTSGGGSSLLNTRLLNLERVEVVKGPQSALYGRNAFAGAINYITKQPSFDGFEITTYADKTTEYGIYDLRFGVNGPIIQDQLAVAVTAGIWSSDGFYDNKNSLDPVARSGLGGGDSKGIRFVALWQPSDTLSVTANVSYNENDTDPRAVAPIGTANTFYLQGNQLPAGTTPDYTFNGTMDYGQFIGTVPKVDENDIELSRSFRDNRPFEGSEDDTWLTYLKIEKDFGAVTGKSLTSYLYNEAKLHEDVDFQTGFGTPITRNGIDTNFSVENDYLDQTETKYYSQEFTVESNEWARGRWLVGAQGFWERTQNWDKSIGWFNDPDFDAAFPDFCVAQNPLDLACSYRDTVRLGNPPKTIDRDTDSYSVYGLIGYDLTDKISLTAEARYIYDKITVETNTSIDRVGQYILAVPIDFSLQALPVQDEQTSDTVNPRFAIDYRITEDIMFYGSAAKGTKPAGFGTAQFAMPQNTRVGKETLWGYELGTKTQWFDGTLQANLALYFNQYEDRQVGVTVRDPVSGWASAGIVNAGEAETKGVEVDLTWAPLDPLTLSVAYSYTDAEFTDFDYTDIRGQSSGELRAKDQAICGSQTGDCSGADVAGVPEHSASFLANYTAPLTGEIEWFVNTIAVYTDERALYDRVRTAYTDDLWVVDAQIGLQTDNWSVQLYAENLLDDDTTRWGQGYNDFKNGMYGGSSGGEPRDETIMAFLPPPRVVGVRATWRFDR